MINGLYLSAQGAQAQQTRLDVVSNNLANASTTAFKRDLAIFQAHEPFDLENGQPENTPVNLQDSWGGVTVAEIETDFSQNPLEATEGALDVALTGPGFIKVAAGGKNYLTRDGAMIVDSEGNLLTAGGANVLSDSGTPLQIDTGGGRVTIASDGTISQESSQGLLPVGKIALVQPQSNDQLKKIGSNLYENLGGETPAGPELSLKQGFLEASGVVAVHEMVQLIETSRAFEANINMIKYQDDALGTLLSTVPRL